MKQHDLGLGKMQEQNRFSQVVFCRSRLQALNGKCNLTKSITLNWLLMESFWPVLSLLFQGEKGWDGAKEPRGPLSNSWVPQTWPR